MVPAAWLHFTNVWGDHLSETGNLLIAYHLARTVFLMFFAWLVFAVGEWTLAGLSRSKRWAPDLPFGPADRFLIASFTGAAALTLVMFVLGYLKAYYFPLALAATTFVVYRSGDRLWELAGAGLAQARRMSAWRALSLPDRVECEWIAVLLTTLASAAALLLVNKGFFPDIRGRGDSFGHYLPYYRTVLENHGIWPNQYFLHYYYSKGAGLHFLAMLLTDLQSASLVSLYFVLSAVTAITVFSL